MNPEKIRIGIIGLGGVGGYFGGLLAEHYFNSSQIEIIFIARPATANSIKKNGLKIITPTSEKIIFPHLVTSNPATLETLNYLICAVKSYDLESSLLPLKNCISNKTIILPLLNGVDAKERIKSIYPNTEVLDGCVYIVSRLIEPGVIKETGNMHTLYFGSNTAPTAQLKELEKIFLNANIECTLSENIEQTIWEKFIFISSIASLTSYLNLSIGAILSDPAHKQLLLDLINELKLIAKAKKISLGEDILEKTILKMEKLPYDTTSSMHSDFLKGGKTEYNSLTAFVVKCGKEHAINTPTYNKILNEFIEKEKH